MEATLRTSVRLMYYKQSVVWLHTIWQRPCQQYQSLLNRLGNLNRTCLGDLLYAEQWLFFLHVRSCVGEAMFFLLQQTYLSLAETRVGKSLILCLPETLLQQAETCTRLLPHIFFAFTASKIFHLLFSHSSTEMNFDLHLETAH